MEINTYFTQQTDVKRIILDLLDSAKSQVIVAVAWFTERELFSKLLELQSRGVEVELVITNHKFNTLAYSEIEDKGGFFAEIGNDDKLMHMKFCVIDYGIVISGSANWSKRAFKENNEEVTIVEGNPQRANDFIDEFTRLKELSGKNKILEKELDLSKALKTFDLIQAFINLGETSSINQYTHQLKNLKEIEHIVNHLFAGKYDVASREMFEFKKEYTQLVDITASEKVHIQTQIRLLSMQIEFLEIEKTETEALVEQFNHRYVIELNPLIAKVLLFKKKLFEKLKKHGVVDDTYKNIEEEFIKNNEEYEKEIEKEIPDLSKEESKSLKEKYRDAVKYCHPDSSQCIFEDKDEASKTFNSLTEAYKANNTEKVSLIYSELKLGKPIKDIDRYNELDFLRAKLSTLRKKYEILIREFEYVKSSDSYKTIEVLNDWDEYFKTQKILLNEEIEKLNTQYAKHE